MNNNLTFASGLGLGAGLMLMLDPDRGARRRALMRDKAVHGLRVSRDAVGPTSRDFANRLQGAAAEARNLFRREDTPDEIVVERVRATLGRVVSHPHAIQVTARDGIVTLSGVITAHEHKPLLRSVKGVRGVHGVEDRLEPHKHPDGIPSLQGGASPPGEPFELWQRRWAPAPRLIAGMGGAALAAYGTTRRDMLGAGLALVGVGLVIRGLTNLETRRLVGIGAGRRAIDIQKTIRVAAPVNDVFGFWREYENFPYFMSHVREIRPTNIEGQSHWIVSGPAGLPIEFDAVVTELIPDHVIAWKSVEGSPVGHAGIVHFEANADGTTRVHMRVSYNPPGGALGHAVAALLGSDLRAMLHEDLVRMKTLIETGRPPHDAAKPVDEAMRARPGYGEA